MINYRRSKKTSIFTEDVSPIFSHLDSPMIFRFSTGRSQKPGSFVSKGSVMASRLRSAGILPDIRQIDFRENLQETYRFTPKKTRNPCRFSHAFVRILYNVVLFCFFLCFLCWWDVVGFRGVFVRYDLASKNSGIYCLVCLTITKITGTRGGTAHQLGHWSSLPIISHP